MGTDQPTNQRTYQPTDEESYKDYFVSKKVQICLFFAKIELLWCLDSTLQKLDKTENDSWDTQWDGSNRCNFRWRIKKKFKEKKLEKFHRLNNWTNGRFGAYILL
jgi:hypothetical protein